MSGLPTRTRPGSRPGFRVTAALGAVVLAAALLALATPAADAAGSREKAARETEPRMTLIGTVRLVGSEPFVRPVLTDAEGTSYLFDGDDVERFRALSGLTVVVECTVNERTLSSADGKYRTVERVLRNVRLRSGP